MYSILSPAITSLKFINKDHIVVGCSDKTMRIFDLMTSESKRLVYPTFIDSVQQKCAITAIAVMHPIEGSRYTDAESLTQFDQNLTSETHLQAHDINEKSVGSSLDEHRLDDSSNSRDLDGGNVQKIKSQIRHEEIHSIHKSELNHNQIRVHEDIALPENFRNGFVICFFFLSSSFF